MQRSRTAPRPRPRAEAPALPQPRSLRAIAARQFASLAVYNYRVYFIGQLISLVGTWMQTTAQAWLVLKLTGSPLALGTVTTLQFLPITVFTLFGGAFADRLPKRRALVITQSLAMTQAAVLALLVATGRVQLWHVYALALWLGTVNAFDGPVRQSFVVELVGRERLVNAVALNSSIFNLARIAGPAVAGVTIAAIGLSWAFAANAASFLAVLAAYALMRPSEFRAVPKSPARGNVLRQVRDGLAYSARTPAVAFFFILLGVIGTFGYNFTVIVPLVAEFVLHVGPQKFGMLTSAMGAGSLTAALIMAATGRLRPAWLLLASAAFSGLLAAVAFSPLYAVTVALLFFLGIVGVAFSTTINTSLQVIVPDELRGRVMSIFFLLFAGSTPIGGYITGFLAEHLGVRVALTAMASLCAAGTILAAAYYIRIGRDAFRALEAEDDAETPAAGAPAVDAAG
ncbi:MAG: MFS transporter [Tepidiforma sp.]|jgi:MFS family permease|uniref:MFS transporter n=1 Tax=Tepidiforma bonchosmolovskayae TaxID=2601677 RepID=A0ABX6C0V7_9CHLR|nr:MULTISPECIES: MFS transporter [Tepidiforma]QFG02741.1 MFS transporter [Tepidiforma bonchosmolovskayae]GIW14340.1 MAG: MFS transporter [Tepidiforma sp.]GIW57019.1 MAG: MFS transporter [Nitrospiraceae bacterium]